MLFNSYIFLFAFLPVTLLGFYLIQNRGHHSSSIFWLVAASLFFYGWWNPAYLVLLVFSTIFNFIIGIQLGKNSDNASLNKIILIIGVVANLSVLGYFKYANFFIDNLNAVTNNNLILNEIILPLGISFFTFQQISYLVDAYYNETREHSFLHYCLFVTFFPQLIAGPIVHHKEMLPQFIRTTVNTLKSKNLSIGFTIFCLGLFKKVILADGISIYASPIFDAAEAGVAITFFEAWSGAFAYTFQLYFDFSGYSDMAIGLARMFGIRLPINFNSPYKATNISDFWKRWHITLSRLIRDYLWDPVSLSLTRFAINQEYGVIRIYILTVIIPIIFSFFWIGLWHGAGWNFIIFGFMHGFYIVFFNLWSKLKVNFLNFSIFENSKFSLLVGWSFTFICVVFGWVLFRAESLESAQIIIYAMLSFNDIVFPENIYMFKNWFSSEIFINGLYDSNFKAVVWILILLFISLAFPNTLQIMKKYRPAIESYRGEIVYYRKNFLLWRPKISWALFTAVILVLSILNVSGESEFLYFQF